MGQDFERGLVFAGLDAALHRQRHIGSDQLLDLSQIAYE